MERAEEKVTNGRTINLGGVGRPDVVAVSHNLGHRTRMLTRALPEPSAFNAASLLPYQLRRADFELAMQDVYDLLFDLNTALLTRSLPRIEETVRPAILSGILSDTVSASLARHSRALVLNTFHNGHPDLIPQGKFAANAVQSGGDGIEVKTTKGRGGVDAHGARPGWFCLFRYATDVTTEPATDRRPSQFTEVLLANLELSDFRSNDRAILGTRTSSPNAAGLAKLRSNWVYRLASAAS